MLARTPRTRHEDGVALAGVDAGVDEVERLTSALRGGQRPVPSGASETHAAQSSAVCLELAVFEL